MATISLCMIVKDEEENIKDCLDSVQGIADEIIIVDTGSTDNTKSIAKNYTTIHGRMISPRHAIFHFQRQRWIIACG